MPPAHQTKHITTKATVIEDGDGQGLIEAAFSVFDVVDSDGDVVLRSAFTDGQEVPMVWSHDWAKPIGKGVVRVERKQAVFKGQLWLDTEDGQQAFRKIRNSGSLQEFSWGFQVTDAEPGVVDGKDVRLIKGAELFEVSPVLVGANRHTRVLSLKSSCCEACAEKDDAPVEDLEEKPYGIRRRGDEYCVYNTETGATVNGGCHPTRAEALRHQRALMVNVPDARPKDGEDDADLKSEWDAAYVNNLSDSAFAVILPGGERDSEGKTTPRSLRKLPHHNAEGGIDLPHLRNALSREPQTDMPEAMHARAHAHLMRHASAAGMDTGKQFGEVLEAFLAEFAAEPPVAESERKQLAELSRQLSKAQRDLELLLKRTDPIAQVEPRNQYRRFLSLAAQHGLPVAPSGRG